MSLVSSPTSGLAVEDDGAVALGNLYYFSWAGFITGVVLLASFCEDYWGISVRATLQQHRNGTNHNNGDNANANANGNSSSNNNNNVKSPSMAFLYWFALMTTSIVIMGSSADLYNQNCDVANDLKPQPFCARTRFAITIGVMSTIASLLICVGKLLNYNTPFLIEVLFFLILTILHIFELISVTGGEGPGSPLGNLYYFSWISFLLCLGIGRCCYEDYQYAANVAEEEFESSRRVVVPTLEGHDNDDDDLSYGSREDDLVVVENGGLQLQQQQEEQAARQKREQQYEQVSSAGSPRSRTASGASTKIISNHAATTEERKLKNDLDEDI